MTKKSVFISLLLTAMLSFTSENVYADPTDILLQVSYEDPDDGETGQHRGPVFIPSISIDGYSLIFNTPCDGCMLRLLDEDGYVVYTTVIPNGSTNLVLPSYLSGEYEIQIIQSNLCFYGYITL
jgi:hypothetical protein